MSKDKYPSILLKPNGGYCVYYPSNSIRNVHLDPMQNYSFVHIQNSPTNLARDSKFFRIFVSKTRLVGLF